VKRKKSKKKRRKGKGEERKKEKERGVREIGLLERKGEGVPVYQIRS
jgi:hypothetical protein